MRIALAQMTASDVPQDNLTAVLAWMEQASAQGADLLATPEVTNCLSASRDTQRAVLHPEVTDPMVLAVRDRAAKLGLWVALGSVAVKTDDPQGRFANRSILVDGSGGIVARYDKIHMFDVAVSKAETYRESAGYRPGDRAVVADTPWGRIGLTICYDLRFGQLYRDLAQAGAGILLVPSAFSQVTGAAHWEVLLRARAIETGAFVVAAAQTGLHPSRRGPARKTYGHSLVVDPWGQVLLDAGTAPGLSLCDLDMGMIATTRDRIPSVRVDAPYAKPVPR